MELRGSKVQLAPLQRNFINSVARPEIVYLNSISLEYENIEKKGPPLNEKLTKFFQDLIWNNTKPEKIEILLKNVLPPKILKV